MRRLGLIVGLGVLALPLGAAQQNLANTEVGARFLNLPGSARASAQGGAVGASQGSLDALGVNPAGLAGLESMQASFTHSVLQADSSLEHVGLGMGLGEAALGLGMDYLSYGAVSTYSLDAGGFPVAGETLRPYALGLNLGYAQPVGWGLSLGASAKWLSESLGTATSSALAFDAGVQWWLYDHLNFGLSAVDMGGALNGATLPSKARLSSAYDFGGQLPLPLRVAADLLVHVQDQNKTQLGLGLELTPISMLALRAGYRAADVDSAGGAAVGLGFKRGWLALDYAYDFAGALGATQRFSLSVALPKGSAPIAVVPEATPMPTPVATEVAVPAPLSPTVAVEVVPTPDPVQALMDAVAAGDESVLRTQTEAIVQGDPAQWPRATQKLDDDELMPAVFDGDFKQAERAATVMTQVDPENARAYQALGVVRWHQGDVAGCLANLKKAYAMDPSREYLKAMIKKVEGR